jgi:hypothetical protein
MEWLGKLFASEELRGGAIFVAAFGAVAALVLQVLRNFPVLVKLDDENRKALDASVQAELVRLGTCVSEADKRHAECEERQLKMQSEFLATVRRLEEEIAGLRRQLAQYQQTTIRTLRNRTAAPKGT